MFHEKQYQHKIEIVQGLMFVSGGEISTAELPLVTQSSMAQYALETGTGLDDELDVDNTYDPPVSNVHLSCHPVRCLNWHTHNYFSQITLYI